MTCQCSFGASQGAEALLPLNPLAKAAASRRRVASNGKSAWDGRVVTEKAGLDVSQRGHLVVLGQEVGLLFEVLVGQSLACLSRRCA